MDLKVYTLLFIFNFSMKKGFGKLQDKSLADGIDYSINEKFQNIIWSIFLVRLAKIVRRLMKYGKKGISKICIIWIAKQD